MWHQNRRPFVNGFPQNRRPFVIKVAPKHKNIVLLPAVGPRLWVMDLELKVVRSTDLSWGLSLGVVVVNPPALEVPWSSPWGWQRLTPWWFLWPWMLSIEVFTLTSIPFGRIRKDLCCNGLWPVAEFEMGLQNNHLLPCASLVRARILTITLPIHDLLPYAILSINCELFCRLRWWWARSGRLFFWNVDGLHVISHVLPCQITAGQRN